MLIYVCICAIITTSKISTFVNHIPGEAGAHAACRLLKNINCAFPRRPLFPYGLAHSRISQIPGQARTLPKSRYARKGRKVFLFFLYLFILLSFSHTHSYPPGLLGDSSSGCKSPDIAISAAPMVDPSRSAADRTLCSIPQSYRSVINLQSTLADYVRYASRHTLRRD